MHDGRCSFRRNLVPNIPNHPGNHGPLSSPTSLRGQQTLFGGSFLGLRNLFHQLFCTRSSTATLLFWKRNQIRSSWAFALSSNPLPCVTAPRATSTRSWHHFRHHHWRCNYQGLYLDYSWSPNVRTLRPNGLEVLPRCLYRAAGFLNPI